MSKWLPLGVSPAYLIIFLIICFSSCNNPSIMFRAKRNYPYDDLSKIISSREYKVGINDRLSIRVIPNKGAALLDASGQVGQVGGATQFNGEVEFDGTIKMPLLGRVQVKGLSIRECELLFEEIYKQFYVEPFVNVEIQNKRVFFFPGEGGAASVLNLANKNTTLFEALAMAGGMPGNARAHRIKLIRGDFKNPKIYLIDISTLEGMKKADLVLEGNDIVYIEPRNDLVLNFFQRISPYFSVLSFGILVWALIPGK